MTTDTRTAASVLASFERAFADLDQTVRAATPRELTGIRDPAGWSAKDHVMHVALWEQAMLAKVDGRPRHEALGISPDTDGSSDWDAINAAIFANTRHIPLDDVLKAFRTTHDGTRARLAAIVNGAEAGDVLLAEVPGYTEHYEQHRGWILDLIRQPAS